MRAGAEFRKTRERCERVRFGERERDKESARDCWYLNSENSVAGEN